MVSLSISMPSSRRIRVIVGVGFRELVLCRGDVLGGEVVEFGGRLAEGGGFGEDLFWGLVGALGHGSCLRGVG